MGGGKILYKLILGNKVYSGWSLRAWLLFKHFEIEFEHQVVPLYTDEFEKFRKDCFPARQLPALLAMQDQGSTIVWDSLSIAEFLHDQHPEAGIWPIDPIQRAAARSLCAEMHSGFKSLRSKMPVNLKRMYKNFRPDPDTLADIERIVILWSWAQSNWGGEGPYLFGNKFTAVDAFFTPVASRFKTYSIDLDDRSRAYMNVLLCHPATEDFYEDAQYESWVMEHNEFDDE